MSLRWSPDQLAEFQRRQQRHIAEGKVTVRTHRIQDEVDPGFREDGKPRTPVGRPRATRGPDKQPRELKGSAIENLFAQQIQLMGLPAPVREHPFLIGRRHRLDFAWPDRRLGVEVQGMVHRIKERFEADIEKRAIGLMQGWTILEVSGATVRSGVAVEWLATLLKNYRVLGR